MTPDQLLNDFPKFSPWPFRLLGIEPWEPRKKIASELIREYEDEKWGPLWKRVSASKSQVTLDQVEKWMYGDQPESLCLVDGNLQVMSAVEGRNIHLEIVLRTLLDLLPASALVELGAGYGHIILNLVRNQQISRQPVLAGEFASSGTELIRYLAKAENMDIQVGDCDFSRSQITNLNIPENALCFTSYATTCIPEFSSQFIENIMLWRPKAVVHFEPMYEHCDLSTLLGAMQHRYIEVNDYNRNLLTVLRDSENKGNIQILLERPQVFGSNSLLPFSIVVWKPVN